MKLKNNQKYFFLLLIAGVLLSSLGFSKKAFAADVSTCLSSSGASSITAVQNVCSRCASSKNKKWGALWFNNNNNKDYPYVNVKQGDKTVPITLYGQVYQCGSDTFSGYGAKDISFSKNYVSFSGNYLNRGAASSKYTWGSTGTMSGTLDVEAFKNDPGTTKTTVSDVATVYTGSVNVTRTMDSAGGFATTDPVVITLSETKSKDVPTNREVPPDITITTTEEFEGSFYSLSIAVPIFQYITIEQDASIDFEHYMGAYYLKEGSEAKWQVMSTPEATDCSSTEMKDKILGGAISLITNGFTATGDYSHGPEASVSFPPDHVNTNSKTVKGCVNKGRDKMMIVPVVEVLTWENIGKLKSNFKKIIEKLFSMAKVIIPKLIAFIRSLIDRNNGGDGSCGSTGGCDYSFSDDDKSQLGGDVIDLAIVFGNTARNVGASVAVGLVGIAPDSHPFMIDAIDQGVESVEPVTNSGSVIKEDDGSYTMWGTDKVNIKYEHILKRVDSSSQLPTVGGPGNNGVIIQDDGGIIDSAAAFTLNDPKTYHPELTGVEISPGQKSNKCSTLTFTPQSGKATTEGKIDTSAGMIPGESVACATIGHPYNFKLTPVVTVKDDSDQVIYAGTTKSYKAQVKNEKKLDNRAGTKSAPIDEAKVITFVTDRSYDESDFGSKQSSSDPCDLYNSLVKSSKDCKSISVADENKQINTGATSNLIDDIEINIPDSNIGDKFCFTVAIKPSDSGDGYNINNEWITSGLTCRAIAKKPTFQVVGGSLYSAQDISAATTTKGDKTYGSWVEYAVVSKGEVKNNKDNGGLASGAGNNGIPKPKNTNFATSRSKLTISNTNASELGKANIDIGDIKDVPAAIRSRYATLESNCNGSDYYANYVYNWTVGHVKEQEEINNNFYYFCNATGDMEINGTPNILDDDHTFMVFYAKGDINITNNVHYDGGGYIGGAHLYDEPFNPSKAHQVIIVADGNINIASNVTQVDAWLIAGADNDNPGGGTIDTCKDHAVGNDIAIDSGCGGLIVRGPVFAKKLILDRTAGMESGESSKEPAEKFILPVEAYYWAYDQAQKNAQFFNATVNELAPRY